MINLQKDCKAFDDSTTCPEKDLKKTKDPRKKTEGVSFLNSDKLMPVIDIEHWKMIFPPLWKKLR